MFQAKVAPYGSWKSPITSDLIVSDSIGLGQIVVDCEDIYWIEMRPEEDGRHVVVRRSPDGQVVDVTPSPFNVRTRVHEYGGGAFTVSDRVLYFSNFDDQRLYRQDDEGQPTPITPIGDMRYADGVIDRLRGRMVCVREDHTVVGREAVNSLVSLDLKGEGGVRIIASGNDFYSSPRISPDGSRLAWITWNHPNMPWDSSELWMGIFDTDGTLSETQCVAGGSGESVFQPEWSLDDILHFVSDRSGWWNIYQWCGQQVKHLLNMEAEFGRPQWVLGMSTYAFESDTRLICTYTHLGTWHLASVNTKTGEFSSLKIPYSEMSRGDIKATSGQVVFSAGSPIEPFSIVKLDLLTGRLEVLRRTSEEKIDEAYLSKPEIIEFPTEGALTAHGLFYPPTNGDYVAPVDELPPLLVVCHGGPTGTATTELSLQTQFWTSRGIAVLDVNYGGSTGYGTVYRRRLNGRWGIVDLDDCVNGARYLALRGDVDVNRLAIRGGSAGGYTTLATLTFRDVFKAGASYYGVSDLEALTKETHKFESRYLDTVVGPYPDRKDLYIQRSPIHHTERLSCPVILFQGLEDKVVPPNQAELMAEALRKKGLPVAYVPFEGEQHGFRRAENIKRALDCELYFYSRVFGFQLSEPVKPVAIENL